MARCLIAGVFLIAAVLLPLSSRAAGELAEPNRPWVRGVDSGDLGADGLDLAPELQMVILPRKGKPTIGSADRRTIRPAAIINGKRLELGALFGEAKLVAVHEDRVVLLGPNGQTELRLTPDLKKRPVPPGRGAKPNNPITETSREMP